MRSRCENATFPQADILLIRQRRCRAKYVAAHGFINNPRSGENMEKSLENVHQCPRCGHTIRIEQIEVKAISVGIITCLNCGYSGPINLQIVEGNTSDHSG